MSKYREDIIRLRTEGKTYNQIVEELGCTKSTVCYYLGSGQHEKTSKRRRDRRTKVAKYLQELKQSTPCKDCGENYPYWIMEFDHLSNKLFNISQYRNSTESLEQVQAEVAKCDIVCANCHKDRTFKRVTKTGHNSMDVSSFYE